MLDLVEGGRVREGFRQLARRPRRAVPVRPRRDQAGLVAERPRHELDQALPRRQGVQRDATAVRQPGDQRVRLGRSQQHGGGLVGGRLDLARTLEQGHRQPRGLEAQARGQVHGSERVRVGDEQHVDAVRDFVAVRIRQEPVVRIDVGQVHRLLRPGARTTRDRSRRRGRSQGRKRHLAVSQRQDDRRHAREPQRHGVVLGGGVSGTGSGGGQSLQPLEGAVGGGVGQVGQLQAGAQPQVAVRVHQGPAKGRAPRCGLRPRVPVRVRSRVSGRVAGRVASRPFDQLDPDLPERRSRQAARVGQRARQRPRRPEKTVFVAADHGQPPPSARRERCRGAFAGARLGRPERRPRQPRFRQGAPADRESHAGVVAAARTARQGKVQRHGLEAQAGRDLCCRHALRAGRFGGEPEGDAQSVGNAVLVLVQQKAAVVAAGRDDEQRRQVEVLDLRVLTGKRRPDRNRHSQQDRSERCGRGRGRHRAAPSPAPTTRRASAITAPS